MNSFLPPPRPPDGSSAMRSRRIPRCVACWLPPSLCVCDLLVPLDLRTRLVILVHHVERTKSSNTGRLVAKMVPQPIVRVHGDPAREPHAPIPEGPLFLLFPDPNAIELSSAVSRSVESPVLIVPDGSWPQARRMCRRDPIAKNATMVKLPEGPATRYGLRRNARTGTVSTMEAVARALGILDGPAIEEKMLTAFEAFVDRSMYVRTHSGAPFLPETKTDDESTSES
ncbi:MAG TPA: tRNA-uridine aminocarboxypropyltransferase [Polyangium sp.]|nr:tRNA-uridine aminocarboxypropyltransferase [Polyangium sp.]